MRASAIKSLRNSSGLLLWSTAVSSNAFNISSELLPNVEIETAVFRRISGCGLGGRGGDLGFVPADVARLSHPNGVVLLTTGGGAEG